MKPAGIEMSDNPAFARRVVRLAFTSAVALGALLYLYATTLDVNRGIAACLAGGWLLMPSILGLSVRWPRLRYAIFVPASLITLALVVICATALSASNAVARAGWLMTTTGIMMGGVLGLWFWYRVAPVPAGLNDPFSRGRWTLVGIHIALVVSGLAMITVS